MSTINKPVGPEGSKVYWRRRILVLLGVVGVIAIVVLIIVRPGSSSTVDNSKNVIPELTSAPTSSAVAPGTVVTTPAGDGEAAPCEAANIVVTPITDADTYATGGNPQVSVGLTNTGKVDCSINVGTAQQVYTITSGTETYWTSKDCQKDPTDTPTVIAAGATLNSTPLAWDRTRSAADTCDSPGRPEVPAAGASYHLDTTIGGFDSTTSKQFILN